MRTMRLAPAYINLPEGDEVCIDEGRAGEGTQKPQDGCACGHVSPPDLGQECLE